MTAMSRLRHILVEAECANYPRPISWEQDTTRTDAQLSHYIATVVSRVCKQGEGEAHASHQVTITEIPQTSTGVRRGN